MKTKKQLELEKIELECKIKKIDLEIKYLSKEDSKIGFKT